MEGNVLANRSSIDRSKTDFYATPKDVTTSLLEFLKIPEGSTIWECACGDGSMAEVIKNFGYNVISTDLNNTGYGKSEINFLSETGVECDWIITNPPFNRSVEFIEKCIELEKPFALLLKSQYWHSKKRTTLFNSFKPKYILPLTWRPDFLFGLRGGAPTMECIWTVWGKEPSLFTEYILLERR